MGHGASSLVAQDGWDVYWNGYPGSLTSYLYFSVHNPTSSPIVFAMQYGGGPSTGGTTLRGPWQGVVATFPVETSTVAHHAGPSSGFDEPYMDYGHRTVAPGATVYFGLNFTASMTSSPPTGWRSASPVNYSVSFPYYDDGVLKTAGFARASNIVAQITTPIINPLGDWARQIGGSSWRPYLGQITLGSLPATGKITISGLNVPINGAAKVQIMIGNTVVAENLVTHGTGGDSIPPLVYNTATPAVDEGKRYKLIMNGFIMVDGEIVLDVGGGYEILFNAADVQMEGVIPDLALDDAGDPLPVSEPDQIAGAGSDPSHSREDPEPVNDLGDDPKEDDDDENLSVKDLYRAHRAAIEDAMHSRNPQFDFGAWARKGEDAKSGEGEGLGEGIGDGIGALSGLVDDYTFGMPGGGNPGITLHYGNGSVMGVITPPPGASAIRQVLLVFVTIIFFVAMVGVIRSGFTGK